VAKGPFGPVKISLRALFSTNKSVSLKSLEHFAGWDAVRSALAEIHASHDELDRFFADEFARLETLSHELADRYKQIEAAVQRQSQETGTAPAEAQRQIEALLNEARQQQGELRTMQAMIQNQIALLSVSAELGAPQHGLLDADIPSVQGSTARPTETSGNAGQGLELLVPNLAMLSFEPSRHD
jgi:hypothetical protein